MAILRVLSSESCAFYPNFAGLRLCTTSVCLVVALLLCNLSGCETKDLDRGSTSQVAAVIRQLIHDEELVLELSRCEKQMQQACLNLVVPGKTAESLFAENVEVKDVIATIAGGKDAQPNKLQILPESTSVARDGLALFHSLFDRLSYLRDIKFTVVSGQQHATNQTHFETAVCLQGTGVDSNDMWHAFEIDANLTWEKTADHWKIIRFICVNANLKTRYKPYFQDVTKSAIRDAKSYRLATRSIHEENMIELATNSRIKLPHATYMDYLDLDSSYQHPGLSVVDIDGDGWDDLYTSSRWSPNQLLRNNRDGTFTDVAQQYGLDGPGLCTGALFLDLDNDGDLDFVVGRSLVRSAILFMENGKYKLPAAEQISVKLPYLVSSISAADYNQDGLLDIYFCTYGPLPNSTPINRWARDFLTPTQQQELISRKKDSHRFLNLLGPPNVLLVNRGDGNFEVAPESRKLEQWLNTSQATWCDYDSDGDQDLYVCNDFGPDHFYRNDGIGENGHVDFAEISQQLAGDWMTGFGKGASWGDMDNSGSQDLLVCNVFSNAGQRISKRFETLDQRTRNSANGNRLYNNKISSFEQAAGSRQSDLQVADVGWSYGGQFLDVDNDGYLDIYACSGYYSAPDELESQVDVSTDFWRAVVREDPTLDRLVKNALASNRSAEQTRFFSTGKVKNETSGSLIVQQVNVPGIKGINSFSGHQVNRLFINRDGRSFDDASFLSGANSIADGRSVVLADFDHDGWQDIAVSNANSPQLSIYLNQGPDQQSANNHFLAIRLFGSNQSSLPSKNVSTRDAVGSIIKIKTADRVQTREVRLGEGFAAQNSRVMLVGLGTAKTVEQLSVVWPSGQSSVLTDIPADHLVLATEPSPNIEPVEPFQISPYRTNSDLQSDRYPSSDSFTLGKLGNISLGLIPKSKSKLRLVTIMATWCPECKKGISQFDLLDQVFSPDELALIAVPGDLGDSPQRLAQYLEENSPPYQLVDRPRSDELLVLKQQVNRQLGFKKFEFPTSFLLDQDGQVRLVLRGVPTVSAIKQILSRMNNEP